MKYALFFIVFGCFTSKAMAQSETPATRIFIVRHGEKEAGKDPLLTADGIKRAGDLHRVLKDEGIQKIYVSRTRRTQMTADSLRIQMKIDTVHYTADTLCDALVQAIMEHSDFGKTILIVAHSNTVPRIIRKLGVTDFPVADLPDHEFDNLFLVTYKKEKAKLKSMKYGAKSAASAAMQ
jgi:broad specificity phosphatase PhoE